MTSDTSATPCAACGKQGAARRCARCKQAWYCGAACQKADWKSHKTTCSPPAPANAGAPEAAATKEGGGGRGNSQERGAPHDPLSWEFLPGHFAPPHSSNGSSLREIWEKVRAAGLALDWHGVLKWEMYLPQLTQGQSDDTCQGVLQIFLNAHLFLFSGTVMGTKQPRATTDHELPGGRHRTLDPKP